MRGSDSMRLLVLAAFTLLLPAPAFAGWYEASTDHFVVYANMDPELLRDYATRLERFDRAMRVVRDMPDRPIGKANRLTVYLVDNADIVAKAYGSTEVAGFYQPRAGETFAVSLIGERSRRGSYDRQLTVLFHEYTHHFLFASWPNAAYPLWFSEGYADFAATAQFASDGTLNFGVPDPYHLNNLEYLRSSTLSVPILVGTEDGKIASTATYELYARGWLLVHYLQFDPARKGQLTTYLKAINAGTAPAVAARVAFGDVRTLERELEKYRQRKTFARLALKPAALAIGPVQLRPLDRGEAATMLARIRVKSGRNRTLLETAERARSAAKGHPMSASAQVVLAEAEFDVGNFDAAEAAADLALAANPTSLEAMLYKGRAQMARATKTKSTDAAAWKEIRRWYSAANRIDPDDPRPLMLFYMSFDAASTTPTANAIKGLEYAFGLAPQDQNLRMLVARQLISDHKAADAINTLRPIAYNPHGGGLAKLVGEVITLLDKGDTNAALARWDGAPDPAKSKNDD